MLKNQLSAKKKADKRLVKCSLCRKDHYSSTMQPKLFGNNFEDQINANVRYLIKLTIDRYETDKELELWIYSYLVKQ